jgi:hypothetical protein
MNNTKQLVDRYSDKQLNVYNLNSKYDLISHLTEALNKFLPEDIHVITKFVYNFDGLIQPLTNKNCNFYIEYKGLETADEFKQRLLQEQIDIDKKVALLNKLAAELDYKLEKVND